MPTVVLGATRFFQNLISRSIRSKINGGYSSPGYTRIDLNPGQRAKLQSLESNIVNRIKAEAEVNIAGRDVDVKMDFDFDVSDIMPDYLCDVGDMLTQEIEQFADKIESGRNNEHDKLVKRAFEKL